MIHKIDTLTTEQQNPNTLDIDTLSTLEMVQRINQEDQAVIDAVANATPQIAEAVDRVYATIQNGGRLIFMGAGTSGRLGVLDASEWFPTYGVGEESVVGIIAGGDAALRNPIEGAEDNKEAAVIDLQALNYTSKDILCVIASSGRTPYCIGALEYAKSQNGPTIAIACVADSEIGALADCAIEAVTGPEVITGSTRMKAGSATKMILNIISTSVMVKSGKVYGNLMVDVSPSNGKLVERAKSFIMKGTGVDYEKASELLDRSGMNVKTAIVMGVLHIDKEDAEQRLRKHQGRIADVIS